MVSVAMFENAEQSFFFLLRVPPYTPRIPLPLEEKNSSSPAPSSCRTIIISLPSPLYQVVTFITIAKLKIKLFFLIDSASPFITDHFPLLGLQLSEINPSLWLSSPCSSINHPSQLRLRRNQHASSSPVAWFHSAPSPALLSCCPSFLCRSTSAAVTEELKAVAVAWLQWQWGTVVATALLYRWSSSPLFPSSRSSFITAATFFLLSMVLLLFLHLQLWVETISGHQKTSVFPCSCLDFPLLHWPPGFAVSSLSFGKFQPFRFACFQSLH